MLLNPQQVQSLLDLIDRFQLLFMAGQFGVDALTDADQAILQQAGIDIGEFPTAGTVDYGFHFGMLSSMLKQEAIRNLDYAQFKRYIETKKFVPLTEQEQGVLDSIKRQSLSDVKGLGKKIGQKVSQEVELLNRQQVEDGVRSAAEHMVEERKGVKYMVSEIGNSTKEWGRDFDRIADFVSHRAFDEGRAAAFERTSGPLAKVYKDVYARGCKHCARLYLTGEIGSEPRVFLLSTLVGNGSNIGRKAADWKAVIGPTHPYCRCTLHEWKEGYEWDDGRQAFIPGKGFVRKVRRNSSIGVTVGDTTTII